MPQWKKLPNGSWGFVPDTNPFLDQLSRSRQVQANTSFPGSVVEAFKSMPSGFIDVPASMLEAAIGVATPGIDLPLEQRLREFANRRQQDGFMFKRDPAYRDAFLPKVGMGLGQVGALTALARLGGPHGMALSALAGIGLGISEQVRRIAQKEQQSGVNVPWYRESAAHLLGGGIGFTEVLPIGRMLRVFPGMAKNRNLMRVFDEKSLPRTTSEQLRSALGGVAFEGIQEGLAQGLQSATARGLYDPDALDDLVSSMVEEAKVGGVVGGIADYLATSMARSARKGRGSYNYEGTQNEATLKHRQNRMQHSAVGQKYIDEINAGLVVGQLGEVFDAYDIAPQLKDDIRYVFNGEYAALPDSMQELLQDGGIDVSTMRELRREFQARTNYTIAALKKQAEKAPVGSSRRQQLQEAARATEQILRSRLQNMDEMLEEFGYGWRNLGGLTTSEQYQKAKEEGHPDPNYQEIKSLAIARQSGQTDQSYKSILEEFMDSTFGRLGLFRAAEVLGVHNGPGSMGIDTLAPESSGRLADHTLSSSDRANFSLEDVGKVLFGPRGMSGTLAGIPYFDAMGLQEDAARIALADKEIARLEKAAEEVLESFPLVRSLAEASGSEYTSDEAWQSARDENAQTALVQRGRIDSLLAEQHVLRDQVYADLLLKRLQLVREQFARATNPDDPAQAEIIKLKERAIRDLGLAPTASPAMGTAFSGGAVGSDTYWREQGKKYGLEVQDFLPENMTEEMMDEAAPHVAMARSQMGKNPSRSAQVEKLIHRNYFQIKNADAVFAVGKLERGPGLRVQGGTGYAVQMGLNKGIPVYVYDQKTKTWFTGDQNNRQEIAAPRLTSSPALIGTRDLSDAGRNAIQNVYRDTFGDKTKVSLNQEAAFDKWLDDTIAQTQATSQKGLEDEANAATQLERLDRQLENSDIDQAERDRIQKHFRPQLRARTRFRRDISAEQLIRIATLFETDPKARAEAIDQRLEIRAGFDIADWQVRNSRALISEGLSRTDPSLSLVRTFVEKVLPARQKENNKRLVTEADIESLLKTKNIFLRGAAPEGKEAKGDIGSRLKKKLGTGVDSRPFRSLLKNLTGAKSWAEATPGQQMMMYSRLLQLPAHRVNPSSDPDTSTLGGAVNFKPVFLPTFQQSEVMDVHSDAILDVLTERDPAPVEQSKVDVLQRRVKKRLGVNFNQAGFNESLASLIEMGILVHRVDPKSKAEVVRVPVGIPTSTRTTAAKRLHDSFLSQEPLDYSSEDFGPGDQGTRIADRAIYEYEVKPRRIKAMLADKSLAKPIEEARRQWNNANPDEQLGTQEFVERFASYLQSELGFQELVDAGVMESVAGRMRRAERAPGIDAIPFLAVDTAAGSQIINAMVSSGAIPSSTKSRASAVRRAHLSDIKKRFEVFKIVVSKGVTKMRLPDNIKVQFVDNANGLFQGLSEVAIRGEMLPETQAAVYDSASNRIIINLAAVDPNNMMDSLSVVQDATFHEGLHALIMRDHLFEGELLLLSNFVKNNVVPEEVDANAHEMGVTWFERSVYNLKDSNLSEGDIEHEAIVSLMQALVQDKVPEARSGNLRKTKGRLSGIIESVVGAAKEADITDVMQILAEVESGRIGERGSGYMGETRFDSEKDEVRSFQLSRYADPAELEQLTKAIALRDAAPSGPARDAQQVKVDRIADTIIGRRTRIQESADPVSGLRAIDNEREGVQETRDTNSYAVPLLNGEMWTSKDNKEARQAALDEYLKARREKAGYTMPREWMDMFDNQTDITPRLEELVKNAENKKQITPRPKRGGFIESLKNAGAIAGDKLAGNTVEETAKNMDEQINPDPKKSTVDGFRYNFLDRRQWLVKQTSRMLQVQNRALLDAETAALVAFRNADNAVNYFPSIMKLGPLSYLGFGTGRGEWDVAPVYDDRLQEKYGGDGRIPGLLEIFAPISKPKDEQAAALYGLAKRIRWTKNRRDELRKSIGSIPPDLRDPEADRKLRMFEQAYRDINPMIRGAKDVEGRPAQSVKKSELKYSEQDLDNIINEVESNNQRIVEFWDYYQAFNRAMLETAYRSGLISLEQRNEWQDMAYTPFYRETSLADGTPIGSAEQMRRRGRANVEKALQGSLEPVDSNLMGNITSNIQALIRDSMMNVAASRTVRDALALGTARQVPKTDLEAYVNQRVIRVLEDGEAKYYELDDAQLAMSIMMLGFNPKKQLQDLFGGGKGGEALAFALTGTSQLLRETVTKTPAFQFKNIFRDSWNASTIVGGGPGLVIEAIKNALNPDTLRRAEEAGLSIGIDFVGERGEILSDKARKRLAGKNLDWTNPMNGVASIWTMLDRFAKQSEVATRVAVHDRVLALTGDRALAQYMAVEIMNYGRRGANQGVSTFLSTVPFMNGRMQGLDVLARGLISSKGSADVPSILGYGMTQQEYQDLPFWKRNRATIVGRGLQLSVATAILYTMFHDDEEYQQLRDEVKADNWLLPLSDHAWLKIPIPFEVGVLFKVIPEQITMALLEADHDMGDVGEETIRQLRTSLSFGGPQLITPLYNAMRNYDTFRKDAIVDQWTALREPNEQREMYTSTVAGGLADLANSVPLINKLDFLTSPMKVEFLMRQYLGTMGMYAVTTADRIARSGAIPGVDPQNIVGTNVDFDFESLLGGEGVANVPLLGDLLIDPRTRAGAQQDFYNILEELNEITATLGAINERDVREGVSYTQKNIDMLRQKERLNGLNRALRQWRQRRDMLLDTRQGMSKEETRKEYQRLLDIRASILRNMSDIVAESKGNR